MTLNELSKLAYKNAQEKGFSEERSFGDLIALCHSELSEALEEYRNSRTPDEVYFNGDKPEGIPIELADVIIRIANMAGLYGIDLDGAVETKMAYNRTRDFQHGGKKL